MPTLQLKVSPLQNPSTYRALARAISCGQGLPIRGNGLSRNASLQELSMKNAINWFEIPSTRLNEAQAFYEAVLGCSLRPSALEGTPAQRLIATRNELAPNCGTLNTVVMPCRLAVTSAVSSPA